MKRTKQTPALSTALRRAIGTLDVPAPVKRTKQRKRRPRDPFSSQLVAGFGTMGVDLTLAKVVREHVAYCLSLVDGNKILAARLLGVNRRTLQRHARR